jgi:transposase
MSEPVRLVRADRSQVGLEVVDLDSLVGSEDRVRSVWGFVIGLDLSELHEAIGSREGHAGRPAIDPAILLCLWLYATLDDVGSARELDRLTRSHLAYRWICGGVSVSYHTLSDFRVDHEAFLDRLLTGSVAALVEAGVATLEEVAQDGLRTRASAASGSFRRRATLETKLAAARERVARLKAELHDDPAASNRRRMAAQARAARQAEQRAKAALEQLGKIEERREQSAKKHGKRTAGQGQARASVTDPEARVIKMADGGFRPGYNLQIATDTASGAIVGVHVSNDTSDKGLIQPMIEDVQRRFSKLPKRWLADTGYASSDNAEKLAAASQAGVEAYMPIPNGFRGEPAKPPPPERTAALAWHERMATETGKTRYKRRYIAEWVNAGLRNRGLVKLTVRGAANIRAVLVLQALTHNMLRLISTPLRLATAA